MSDTSTTTIASFHLIRYDTVGAMRHMAFDRPVLRSTGGLRFWRLLGTGRGPSMSLGADLRRWALFAVWRGEPDLDDFLRSSPIAARWRDEARESWHVRLRPLAARGAWGGVDPFAPVAAPSSEAGRPTAARPAPSSSSGRPTAARPASFSPAGRPTVAAGSPSPGVSGPAGQGAAGPAGPAGQGSAGPAGQGAAGPVAVLTRASIRAGRLAAFYRSVPAVDRALREQDGLLASVGIGEWPLARQATFSLWRDARAVRDFAYGTAHHRTVITRVRAHDWYGEELFARFTPYGSQGAWNGADPLRA